MSLKIDIITLFPEMLAGFFSSSILKKGQEKGLLEIHCVNPRDFTTDKHKTCDDRPYGGGSGMVMKAEPIFKAVKSVQTSESKIILLNPQGEKFSQAKAMEFSRLSHLIFICGHYEGIDERVKIGLADEEISIGDYVLTNGALAAAVVVDAIVRLVPEVLGNPDSLMTESFSMGLLEYPQYTRPRIFQDESVPEILLTGDHQKIKKWRNEEAIKRTQQKRPDLL
ncbi:MAG: tRNA (guanosine(37)-N1)-methyltransferase TrmD [Chlamydiae bacterium]|nr:tRNA (guanosine(37)-N1)-methyltransferase TrmD [Chlamydiota bacterium]MBI3277803.1 tRNA (guanosine(37)-N1)-methyltransferase TrmD [Chlamydiota bacterium]